MSAEPNADDRSTDEQTTLETATTDTASLTDDLEDIAERLNDLDEDDLETLDDDDLVALRNATRKVENATEDTRKDTIRPRLTDDLEPGETVGNLQLIRATGRNTVGRESVVDAADDADVEPHKLMKPNAKAIQEAAEDVDDFDADDLITTYNYEYLQQQ